MGTAAPRGSAIGLPAPAKLNLFLHVLAREETGYHGIETLFAAVDFGDRVELRTDPDGRGARLTVEGEVDTGPTDRNLALLAAERFADRARLREGLEITLTKRVPTGAGLGGGSSDAAAVLRLLDRRFPGRLPRPALLLLGAELGSDVPFFLSATPFALAWDRGGRLLSLPALPARPVLLACPVESVSTADAYGAIDPPSEVREARLLEPHDLASWEGVFALARNDFEPVVLERVPAAEGVLRSMRDAGARIAGVTGSGSALFGVFDGEVQRDAAHRALLERDLPDGLTLLDCRTIERWPVPVDPRPATP